MDFRQTLINVLWELHKKCGSDQEFVERIADVIVRKDNMITEAVRTGFDPRGVDFPNPERIIP